MTRNLLLFIVCFLVIGCGVKRPYENWPAKIVSYSNLNQDQQTQLLGFVKDMNAKSGQTLIEQTNNDSGYPVTISITPPPSDKPLRAGFTVRQTNDCSIQLSDFLFTASKSAYLESVFMHEFGHCAGLEHITTVGAIMFPTTAAFSTYTQTAFASFFSSFTSSMRTP